MVHSTYILASVQVATDAVEPTSSSVAKKTAGGHGMFLKKSMSMKAEWSIRCAKGKCVASRCISANVFKKFEHLMTIYTMGTVNCSG